MPNKVEVLMHPVRIKIAQALMRHKENGLSPQEMLKVIQDVPQATLYRHIQVLLDTGIIRVLKQKKVRSVLEKYYSLNIEEARLSGDDWKQTTLNDKVNYYSYYQLLLLDSYKTYLTGLENDGSPDASTFSMVDLKLSNEKFKNFQTELNNLMMKYYNDTDENDEENACIRTIGITIIPES